MLECYLFFHVCILMEEINCNYQNPLSENYISKLPNYTDDNFSSQMSRFSLPLKMFSSAFHNFQEHCQAGLQNAKNNNFYQ